MEKREPEIAELQTTELEVTESQIAESDATKSETTKPKPLYTALKKILKVWIVACVLNCEMLMLWFIWVTDDRTFSCRMPHVLASIGIGSGMVLLGVFWGIVDYRKKKLGIKTEKKARKFPSIGWVIKWVFVLLRFALECFIFGIGIRIIEQHYGVTVEWVRDMVFSVYLVAYCYGYCREIRHIMSECFLPVQCSEDKAYEDDEENKYDKDNTEDMVHEE